MIEADLSPFLSRHKPEPKPAPKQISDVCLAVIVLSVVAATLTYWRLPMIEQDVAYLAKVLTPKAAAAETVESQQWEYCKQALAFPEQVKGLPSKSALIRLCHRQGV